MSKIPSHHQLHVKHLEFFVETFDSTTERLGALVGAA